MEKNHRKLLLIGCGKLGTVLLKSWIKDNTFNEIIVVQPSLSTQDSFGNIAHLTFVKSHKDVPDDFAPDVVIIAVKPHQVSDLLPDYARYQNSALFVSLATGISVKHFQEKLGTRANIVRLMPNVAVQIGESVNLAYALPGLATEYKNLTEKVFACTGQIVWLNSEELIDKLTPITGSGPAYFFLLTEILAGSLSKHGIDKEKSLSIANQILLGSALLTRENPDLEQLRLSVMSKGGITEAAIKVLHPRLPSLVDEALNAAIHRLEELKQ